MPSQSQRESQAHVMNKKALATQRQEALVISSLPRHPHIAAITELHVHRDFGLLMCQDIAAGGDLRKWLRSMKHQAQGVVAAGTGAGGSLPPADSGTPRALSHQQLGDRVRMLTKVVRGVAFLHSLGFVHQDLKPGNVLVFREDEDGSMHARVADFGLVGGNVLVSANVASAETREGFGPPGGTSGLGGSDNREAASCPESDGTCCV